MNFREKIEQGRLKQSSQPANSQTITIIAANNNEPEEGFDSDFFGIDNIKSLPACIDLRFPEGNRKALPYSYIMELNFEPTDGIEIFTSTKKISITGRNLEKLFDYLTAYRVRYISVNPGFDEQEDSVLFIRKICIENI